MVITLLMQVVGLWLWWVIDMGGGVVVMVGQVWL